MNKTKIKKIVAKEVIVLTASILFILVFWGLTLGVKSFKIKQLSEKITNKNLVIDSLKKMDFQKTLLFYFSEVEEETFLDRLYKDYKTSVFKNTPTFSALIDSLKNTMAFFIQVLTLFLWRKVNNLTICEI